MNVNPERLKALLRDLVDIYSPSGKEEEILEFVRDYLMARGMVPQLQPVDEDRYNIIVLPRGGGDIEVCFLGHLDTVTAYDLDEYGFREDGDVISGLGTADMKSGCAAMIEAFTALAEQERDLPPVALALVVDEEETNAGAEKLVEDYRFRHALIAEPTGLMPCSGHYAYLEALFRTRGRRAHSALPEKGQNAIESMLRLLLSVTGVLTDRNDGLVYNLRDVTGYNAGFMVPDTCESWLDIHLPPPMAVSEVTAALQKVAAEARKSGLEVELEFPTDYPGYRLPDDDTLVSRLQQVFARFSLPWVPVDFRSQSDGNILQAAGIPPVILGPGRLETAHTPDESVDFSQVVRAAELYLALAESCR